MHNPSLIYYLVCFYSLIILIFSDLFSTNCVKTLNKYNGYKNEWLYNKIPINAQKTAENNEISDLWYKGSLFGDQIVKTYGKYEQNTHTCHKILYVKKCA